MPLLLSAGDQGTLFVYDYAESRVKAFSRDGSLLWVSGGPGEGPGEFVNAFDIEGGGQQVWVVDEGAGRIGLLIGADRIKEDLGWAVYPTRLTIHPLCPLCLRGRSAVLRALQPAGETPAVPVP